MSLRARVVLAVLISTLQLGATASAQRASEGRTFTIPVLAHYVSWSTVPGGWYSASVMPILRDNPAGGYSSANPDIIAANNATMTAHGVLPMVSWWGPDTYGGDTFMDTYLSVPGPQLAVLYEATGRLKNNGQLKGKSAVVEPPQLLLSRGISASAWAPSDDDFDFAVQSNADTFVADMVHLHQKYFTGPHADRFLRIDGRPVLFIWISPAFVGPFDKVMDRVRAQVPIYVIGSEFSVPYHQRPSFETVVPAMDAISSYGFYDPNAYGLEINAKFLADYRVALSTWANHLPSHMKIMAPMGFNYDETLIPGRHGWVFHGSYDVARMYAQLARNAIADPCATKFLPLAYITSFDECYEGTCITPSEEYGSAYIDIIRDVFMPPVTITGEQVQACREPPGKGPGGE